MRRRLTNLRRAPAFTLVIAAFVLLAHSEPARAQGGVSTAGGAELVSPVGAQAIGLGQAVVADFLGSESVWWNPGALARATQRELAIHHSQTYAYNGDAVSAMAPIGSIGTVALSADLFDYGTEDATDAGGSYGTFSLRTTILAASFAGHAGSRAYLGVNYKSYRFACTGVCGNNAFPTATTTALDLGLQVRAWSDSSLWIGAALRNVGPRLQVNDAAQADPLPTRLDVGATYAPRLPSLGPDAQVKFAVGVVNSSQPRGTGLRFGADVTWQQRVHVGAGYVNFGPAGSGPTIGVGLATGRLRVDIARLFANDALDATQPPTYLSLRYLF